MPMQVYLSFWPDGCTFAEVEPVLISEGVAKALSGALKARQGRLPYRLL